MTDIEERLRADWDAREPEPIMLEAADEIRRLRSYVRRLESEITSLRADIISLGKLAWREGDK